METQSPLTISTRKTTLLCIVYNVHYIIAILNPKMCVSVCVSDQKIDEMKQPKDDNEPTENNKND